VFESGKRQEDSVKKPNNIFEALVSAWWEIKLQQQNSGTRHSNMERGEISHIGMEGKSQLKYIYTTVVANILQ